MMGAGWQLIREKHRKLVKARQDLASLKSAMHAGVKESGHLLKSPLIKQYKVPKNCVWLHSLPQLVAAIDMSVWPSPILRMFLGESTPTAVMAAAVDPDESKNRGQVCEANFYAGELALRKHIKNEAIRLFQLAAGDSPPEEFLGKRSCRERA
jgi:hypothetical protein